jgi:hypothetical protein
MAKASTVARPSSEPRELSPSEVQQLAGIGAGVLPTLGGEELNLTEAELLLLEGKGATFSVANSEGNFEEENPLGTEDGTRLFRIGTGEELFQGTLTNTNTDREKVYLWHPVTGVKRPLVKAHLFYYVAKGWLPRPPEGIAPPELTIPCPATYMRCKKRKFSQPFDALNHFEKAHSDEFKQRQRERESNRQERIDALIERMADSANNSSGDMPAMAAILMELTAKVEGLRAGTFPTAAPLDGAAAAAGELVATE